MTDWSNVPTFGAWSGRFPMQDRPSAYAIIPNATLHVAVVQTATGYILPGGGIEVGETAEIAVVREVVEECGIMIALTAWRAYATEIVSAESEHTEFVKRSTFCEAVRVPDCTLNGEYVVEWHAADRAISMLAPASHRWAVREWAQLSALLPNAPAA